MRRAVLLFVGLVGLSSTGCRAGAQSPPAAAPERPAPTPAQRAKFADGLAAMTRHDRAGDWSEAACKETVTLLLAGGAAPAASYDAGLVERRCGHRKEAKALFEAALAKDPSLHAARAARALEVADEPGGLDPAISELVAVVRETRFADADTLVALAALQVRRGNAAADDEGTDDLDRARRNLQRALAIDDANMSAMNQLALVHLERARRAAATSARKKAATEALELAALVCRQAIAKNPRFAPLHNTLGLVDVELANLSGAAASFDEARRLDPRLVEAQMNLAAVNLQVRGFARAEEAYRAVLALRPDDYDARIGLALAIRGQIDAASESERVAAASRELEAAKKIAPGRPEAYFNQAVLVQEYGGRTGSQADVLANLARAKGLYEEFLAKADGLPAYAAAKERAHDRLKDLQQIADVARSSVP